MNDTNNPETDSSMDGNEKTMAFNCSICGKEFSNEKRYFGHLRIHSGELLWSCDKCPQSDTSFDTQSKLMTHENLCHTLVRPHKCSKCDDVFDRASQLDYHKRSVHLGEKSQICQICGKGFFRKTDLRTHLNVHLGTNQSICEICGRKFNHVSNLIRHCRTHAGSKPYPCTICGKRFTQISSLARHKRIHSRDLTTATGDNVDEHIPSRDDSPNTERKTIVKRQHYCRICGESFRFLVLLRQHFKIHSKKAENDGNNSSVKDQDQETSGTRDQITEQTNSMLRSTDDPGQSSAGDWENFQAEQEEDNLEESEDNPNSTYVHSNNSIRDHLLELDRKMNAIAIESERDVSISISDILSPYDCDEIELSNAASLETKLYENSNSTNKHNSLEKDYDIVQCLNGVDFTTDIDSQLSDGADEKILANCNGKRQKSSTKDHKNSKSKTLASLNKDHCNKCLHVEGSQLYIEICESDYLKNANLHALELQDIENVALLQEVFDLTEDNATVRTYSQKITECRSRISDEAVDEAESVLDTGEPSLRLVQTETGEQFYELVINNQCSENLVDIDEMEERRVESLDHVDIETNPEFPARLNVENIVDKPESPEKLPNDPNSNEFFQLISNTDSYIHASTQNDTSMPMVRLVQNEDGEQFFELVREQSEYERNREDRITENPHDDKIPEIPSNLDNTTFSIESEPLSATISKPEVQRDNEERNADNLRPAKDRTRKFQCNECDKWFSTAYNCKQHAGTHFSDQQKFQCKDCGMSFAWKSTLNKHLAGNHRPDGPQKFVCKICPKVYSTLSQVNEHVKRDHLKERNHVCTHCGKSFFKKFDLKTHSRTHTDERPYVCRSCGKRFHHQSHIIRHERIHTGERPYSCDICQKSFAQPSALRTHRQRHRDVKIDILEYRMDDDDPLSLAVQ